MFQAYTFVIQPYPGSFPDHLAVTRDRSGKNLPRQPNSDWVFRSEVDLDGGIGMAGAGASLAEIKEAICRDGAYCHKPSIRVTVLDRTA